MAERSESAREVLQRLGKASAFLNDAERQYDAPVACEVFKETLLRGTRALIGDAAGRPLLTSKSCDGTPLTVAHRSVHQLPGGRKVRKTAKQGCEFLVANQFVRADLGGDIGMKTKVLLGEPTPLMHGKTVPSILLACQEHWRTLRSLGHYGCSIEHYCWDRLSIGALEQQTRWWHASQPLPAELPPLADPEVLRLTEFVVANACALHDAHNSLKWAMFGSFADKDLVRDIYIGFEALRRSSDLLSKSIYDWLGARLQSCQHRGESWVEARLQLWLDLGVDPATAELLARQLQLEWNGRSMMFVEGAFADGDLPETVAAALFTVWRFCHFSESRWLTVGASCRTMVAAFLTGVAGLVKHIKKDKRNSLFFLRGFDRLTASRVEFMVCAGVVSRVAEAVQLALMRDNRVAQTCDDLWETAAKELKWVITLPESTYTVLGDLCDRPGAAVKDSCIHSAHLSFHFFYRRVLVPVGELPWCLVKGDIGRNLDDLAAEECPEEPMSKNLWLLMHRQFPKGQLVETVAMLGEAGWTSMPAEQQHASLAQLHKWHPGYDAGTLVARSLLLQAVKLLPSASKEEKAAAKLARRLEHVLKACPGKVSGRHMLVKSMIAICAGKKDEGVPSYQQSMDIICNRCIGRHMAFWNQQTLEQQHHWEGRARERTEARRHLLALEWQVVSAELAKLDIEIDERKLKSTALTMKSAALDDGDLETFGSLWQLPGFRSRVRLAELRADVGSAPAHTRPPAEGPPMWKRPEPTMPEWAKPLVQHRTTFCGSALMVLRANGSREWWKMVFAVQHPKFYLAMCQLHLAPPPPEFDLAAERQPPHVTFAFTINFADCRSAADVIVGAGDQLFVLFRLVHEGGIRLTSDMDPLPIEFVLSGEGVAAGNAEDVQVESAPTGKKDHAFEKLVTTVLPWLAHLDDKQGLTAGLSAEAESGDAAEVEVEIDEDKIWQGLQDLERARVAEATYESDLPSQDFVSAVRGGKSMADPDAILHAMQGQCRGRAADAWARRHGATTFKATFSEHGTSEAKIMTRAWCHRMQFF